MSNISAFGKDTEQSSTTNIDLAASTDIDQCFHLIATMPHADFMHWQHGSCNQELIQNIIICEWQLTDTESSHNELSAHSGNNDTHQLNVIPHDI